MQNNIGWIKLHRGLLDWEWYEDANCFRVFTHLLLTVNIKQKKWRGIVIKEGQTVTGRNKLSSETGLSVQQVRTALEKLEKTNEVTTQKTSVGTVFTINNWKKYQSSTSDQPDTNQGATKEQPQGNQAVTTTKEVQERKEEEEEKEKSDLSPFDLIQKEKQGELESWMMQNQKQIHEFDEMVEAFNNTAGIEILADNKPLAYDSAMLMLRLRNFARSWIANQKGKVVEMPKYNDAGMVYYRNQLSQDIKKHPKATWEDFKVNQALGGYICKEVDIEAEEKQREESRKMAVNA